jgi:ATP-dependent Clp protease adaptor protein ClpS
MKNDILIKAGYQWQTEHAEDAAVMLEKIYNLVLWNDDVNTFDWVIESLVEVCGHDELQAEQCALIIHHNGKCSVKKGDFDFLRPRAEALLDRGLSATIED